MSKKIIGILMALALPTHSLAEKAPGEYWNSGRDCSYNSPPKERTAVVLSFDCETTTHNVKVIESGQDYFIPKSTTNDDPPFCLVHGPADRNTIEVTKERQRMYCQKSQKRDRTYRAPKIDSPPPQ